MIPFNYHHLYYFYTIVKTGSISAACKELRLAQPTLSMQLKQYESWLGWSLFERKSRKLFLTEQGKLIYDYAQRIFDLGRDLQDALRDKPLSGGLRAQLGVATGTPRSFLHAGLTLLLTAYPSSQISVHEGALDTLVKELNEQRLDCILTDTLISSVEGSSYTNHLIGKIPIVFAGAPQVTSTVRRFPEDLEKVPLILSTAPAQIYQQVLDFFAAHKLKPSIRAEVQDIDIASRLAAQGYGITPLNSFTVSKSASQDQLVVVGKKISTGIVENFYLVIRKRKWENPLIQHLIQNFRI